MFLSKRRLQTFKHYWFGLLYIPYIILTAFASFYHPKLLTHYAMILLLPVIALGLIAFLPAGQTKLEGDKSSFWSWMKRVVGIQLICLILFLCTLVAYFGIGPLFTLSAINMDNFNQTLHDYAWLKWTMFPWFAITMWSLCIAYSHYNLKAGPFPHQASQFAFKGWFEAAGKALIENSLFSATSFFLTGTLAVSIILGAVALEVLFGVLPHTHLGSVTFMACGFITVGFLLFLRPRRVMALEKKGYGIGSYFRWIYILMVPTLMLSGVMADAFYEMLNQPRSEFQCECEVFFLPASPSDRFAGFFIGWWVIATPLVGSFIAYISKGRTLREFILGMMALPAMILLYQIANPNWHVQLIGLWTNMMSLETTNVTKAIYLGVMSLFCLTLVYKVTKKRMNNALLFKGVMGQSNPQKAGRNKLHQETKVLGMSKFIIPLTLSSIIIPLMHSVGGWYILQIIILFLSVMVIYHITCSAIIMLHALTVQQKWLGDDED